MKKYIHIGLPKNFSTSLQRDYFSKHPDIYHLGIGLNSNLGYRDSIIEKACEVYLKTCKFYKYQEVKNDLLNHFNTIFTAQQGEHKALGISSEHLSFSFSYDSISTQEKAERILEIFGKDTTILIIVRNQFELLKSLYREYVRVGYFGDFNTFFKHIFKYQDRNFLYDFRYDLLYKTYTNLFGVENVNILFFEDYRDSNGIIKKNNGQIALFEDLNHILEISNYSMSFGHYNEAISSNKILKKAKLNSISKHDLGNHLLESAEKHRIKTYLEEELDFIELEEETYSDVIIKRRLINEAIESDDFEQLTYTCNEKLYLRIKSFYEEGNKVFESYLNKQVPTTYHNLKL